MLLRALKALSALSLSVHPALLALVGALLQPALAEVFDEACFELGKQWVYEAKDMLLCDRSGRRININKYCKAHLVTSQSGRLIIDNSKDEGGEPRKQTGHFPELCLPGQRSYAVQAPWLCTCVMHKGRHRWECVVPEDGAGRGGGEPNRRKRSVGVESSTAVEMETELLHNVSIHTSTLSIAQGTPSVPNGHGRAATSRHWVTTTMASSSSLTASPTEVPDETEVSSATGEAAISGRQASPYRPNVVIDFCDEFGYVHSISSSIRDCACDKDVLVTSFSRDNDLYHNNGLFASYECLPGTYKARCELCFSDTRTCQPTACP